MNKTVKKPMKKTILAATLLSLGLGLAAAPASAADCVFSTPAVADPSCTTEVKPVPLNPSSPGGTPSGSTPIAARPTPAGSLPVTGSETAVLASTGVLLVAGGALLVARTRRTAPAAS